MDQLDKTDGISFRLSYVEQPRGLSLQKENLSDPNYSAIIICPGLAIIDKIQREGGEDSLLAKYYIVDGSIYQAPDIYTILSVRIRSAMFHLQEAVHEVREMFKWNPETGFRKKLAADETEILYTFHTSELDELKQELPDDFKLQNSLLDSLLAEIGIS
ncbi:MED6-domain-containing protein [Histomonas meleagridis]|uniref:MED6-domain-containing protein n=1 Tax=Histomonas meleagridis TaxID=135588 RepID=UPI00355A1426|nr:MED6-domain-containing protein [Histomonas meleagridis]KAH0799946.1 MED6-domain-containing protein [Histomonas meleagridis]